MNHLNKAILIAKDNLKACYGEEGIFAGLNHFKDYWARDSFFASFGCLSLKDYDIVKRNLILFFNNINKKGQVPLRIGKTSSGIILSYFGLKKKDSKRKPIYFIDKGEKVACDQNPLFIILLYEYVKKTRDYAFLNYYKNKMEKIMEWTIQQDLDDDYLIEEEEYCNWADSIKKKGKVLYTNVCYCHSLRCMSKLYRILKNKKKEMLFLEKHALVKKKINEVFWSGEHYIDWIHKEKTYNYFSTDGNLLAILWDIADYSKSKHIEEASHLFDIQDIPSKTVHPYYPNPLISLQIRLIGLSDYHNGLSWLWLGAINALTKHKLKMEKESKEILDKIASLIIENKGVYEVYEKTGRPVKRLIYKSEMPFAWSSGLFIYAAKEILNKE